MAEEHTCIVMYDTAQLEKLRLVLMEYPTALLFVFDKEVEWLLQREKILYISAAASFIPNNAKNAVIAEQWTSIFEKKEFDWLSYEKIHFSKMFFLLFQIYNMRILYYTEIFTSFLQKYSEIRKIIILKQTQKIPPAGDFIVHRVLSVIFDSLQTVTKNINIEIIAEKDTVLRNNTFEKLKLVFLQTGVRVVFAVLHFFVQLKKKTKIKILASDYWHNIAPILNHMQEPTEVVLLDRAQALKAGFKAIFQYRMNFVRQDSFSAKKSNHSLIREEFIQHWGQAKEELQISLEGNPPARDLLLKVMEEFIENQTIRICKDIDHIYAMLKKLQPSIVELRASMSGQFHFPLLALIAKELGIPSIEFIHGLEYFGEGSLDKRHTAEFIGVYGKYIQNEMMQVGFSKEQLPIIGSPRFDMYASLPRIIEPEVTKVLLLSTEIFPGGPFDTYDIAEYFQTVATALQSFTKITTTIKLRPGRNRYEFNNAAIKHAFGDMKHVVASREPLTELFVETNIVISCYTTAALEALQSGKPVVLFAATPSERMMIEHHFRAYAKAGALLICTTGEELKRAVEELQDSGARRLMMSCASRFLKEEFAFDGEASKRAAEFIESIAAKKESR